MERDLNLKQREKTPCLTPLGPIFSWDKRRDIAPVGNTENTLTFAVTHFIQCAKKAIQTHQFFSVALSGGSTPRAIFQKLASQKHSKELDWAHIFLFWCDERSVPPTDPESNFRMAMDAGLSHLPIPKTHIFRMKAEEKIEENAHAYEKKIKATLKTEGFDLIMLGVGEDGHTASLFPKTKALEETKALVVANQVPEKNTWRMTLTYPCINRAKAIAVYAFGHSKAKIIEKIFLENPKTPYPASLVGTPQTKALWILDLKAAKHLTNHLKDRPSHQKKTIQHQS